MSLAGNRKSIQITNPLKIIRIDNSLWWHGAWLTDHQWLMRLSWFKDRKVLDKERGLRIFRNHKVSQKWFYDCSYEWSEVTKRVHEKGRLRGDKKMLALVTIFLATLLISVCTIWMYRIVSGWKGFKQTVVARRGPVVRMKLRAQQGYISLVSAPSRQKARPVRLRRSTGTLKAPWGW